MSSIFILIRKIEKNALPMMSQIPLFIINEVILYRLLDTRYSYAKNTSFFIVPRYM